MKKTILVSMLALIINIFCYTQNIQSTIALKSISELSNLHLLLNEEQSITKKEIPFLMEQLERFNQNARLCLCLTETSINWENDVNYQKNYPSTNHNHDVISLIQILSHAGKVNDKSLKDTTIQFGNEVILERTIDTLMLKITSAQQR